jgi:hypothetical protein
MHTCAVDETCKNHRGLVWETRGKLTMHSLLKDGLSSGLMHCDQSIG